MRTLGVSGSGATLYLAFAADGAVLDEQPYTLTEPAGLAAENKLPALRDEVVRVLQTSKDKRDLAALAALAAAKE